MDLVKELNRLTLPPFAASKVVRYSKEQIRLLQEAGETTPPEKIPQRHGCPGELSGMRWGRGGQYGDGGGKLKWR